MVTKKARRSPGEGSLFQRDDGLWVGSVSYWDNGVRKQRRVTSRDYRAAAAKLKQLKADMDDGLALSAKTTVAEWVTTWMTKVHKHEVRPTTLRGYKQSAGHVTSHLGKKQLAKLTAQDIRKMLDALEIGRRRAEKTYVFTHRILEDARKERLIRHNPCESVHKPEVRKLPPESFALDEVHKIITVAQSRNAMESARWLAAFLTGERQAEVLGLEWNRVDFDRNVIDVSWQIQGLSKAHGCGTPVDGVYPCGRVKPGFCPDAWWDVPPRFELRECHKSMVWTRPKSQAGQRWVPMIPALRTAMMQLRESDAGVNPHGLVFHQLDGRPISAKDDNAAWHALLKDAEVRKLRHHCVRHTTATVLRAAGADEQTRMEILGHNSPEVTRIYAHADQAKNSTMMDALAVLLPQGELGGAD